MKQVNVTVKGISPLLMNMFPMVAIEGLDKMTPENQAEHKAYRDPDTKELYIPGVAIQRTLVNAATFSKGKGRASLQKNVAACVYVTPERVSLGTEKYEIDSRRVVIAATKGAVIRHRPRISKWEVSFEITYDEVLLSEENLKKILDDAGSRVGFLDFRPAKNGPFGRFMVTKWTPVKD